MKKKLLITTQDLNMGGVEISLINLLNSIDYDKWEVDLVTLNDGILKQELNKNVNFVNLNKNTNGLFQRVLKSILTFSLIKKYKTKKIYDVAIAYYGLNNYSDMYVAASNSKAKIIWVHNDFKASLESSKYPFLIKVRNLLMKRKFKYFDKIINVSNSCKNSFESIFTGFEEKSYVIYNLIDEKRILKNSEAKTKFKMKENIFNICAMGRLVKSKQIDKIIKIVEKLKTKNYKVKLYVIGDGPERESLEYYVKQNKLDKEVIFTGLQENPYSILKQANLFISLSKHESLGLVLLEALILNVPVISLNNSGALDVCENIAPKDKIILVKNDNETILENILNNQIKFSKRKFNINEYNKNVKKDLKKYLSLNLK